MANSTTPAPAEPISSEPVIVNSPNVEVKSKEELLEERIKNLEAALESNNISTKPRERSRERSVVRDRYVETKVEVLRYPRYRSRSRSPIRQVIMTPLINNTVNLNSVLLENNDICVEVQSGPDLYAKNMVYLTTNPFHNTDLEKLSWIFKFGVIDSWTQKPMSSITSTGAYQVDFLPPGRRGQQYIPVDEPVYDRYDRRTNDHVPIVKLGNALKVFKDDSEESETSKVKFVSIVQTRNQPNWGKMIVSYSRQTALSDLFHEIINGLAVVFVGAVLKDAAIPWVPVPKSGLLQEPKFRKVDSIKEAKVLEEEGITGFIC